MSQISASELLAQLKLFASHPPESLSQDVDLRVQLYHASREAMLAFESAPDPITRIAVAQQAEWVTLRTCCEMGVFPVLAEGSTPKNRSQIASATKSDPELLIRFLRAGVAFGAVKEVGPDGYALAPSYAQLADPKVAAALPKFADFVHATFYATPGLLADNGYQNPTDPLNTAMQRAFDAAGQAPFEILRSKPESTKAIGMLLSAMGIQKFQRVENVYPVQERLVKGFDPEEEDVFFVDVGAGHGHMVGGLRATMPEFSGRFVAQDLPNMISTAPKVDGVEMQTHNFFDPQPIKNARAYYMRLCLHNWQDKECIAILKQLFEAMKPDHSRLLIHEQVVPERGGVHNPWAAVSDINQMGACASHERTEKQWTNLLSRAGFEAPSFYYPADPTCAAIIEAVR